VSVRIGQPIPTAGLTTADRDQLIARVRLEVKKLLGDALEDLNALNLR
jgi:hypothetical protein